jgi:hypothetical protein
MKKRKITGRSRTFYIQNELSDQIDKLESLADDMNASDIVNMVLKQARLDELIKQYEDGNIS